MKLDLSSFSKGISKGASATKSVGFNPDEVTSLLRRIQNNYDDMMNDLVNGINSFMDGISLLWACPEAIEYFDHIFCPKINNFILKTNESISNIFTTINRSGKNWAIATDSTYHSRSFKPYPYRNIDASKMQSSLNGVIGIKAGEATKYLIKLDHIKEDVDFYLDKINGSISNTAFIGKGQLNALMQSVTNIKNNLKEELIDIILNVKDKIKTTEEKYIQVAQDVSSKFENI